MKEKMIYAEECNQLGRPCYLLICVPVPFSSEVSSDSCFITCSGVNLKSLVHAAENYQAVLTENQKLFNELQELKGDIIRVYVIGN